MNPEPLRHVRKALVANRGEIAVHCIRVCHELSVWSVAIVTPADGSSLHARLADEVIPLPGSDGTTASISRIGQACAVDAIIPGYGLFSGDPDFAEAVRKQAYYPCLFHQFDKIKFSRASAAEELSRLEQQLFEQGREWAGEMFFHRDGSSRLSVNANVWKFQVRLSDMLEEYRVVATFEAMKMEANVLTTLILAVVALGVFLVLEQRFSADPILPRYMITDRVKALGCASAALTYAVWQGSNYLLTLQLQIFHQKAFGYSALATSLRFIPFGVTALVVNFVVPVLIGPVGARTLLVCSWALTLGGLVLFTRMGGADHYWCFCLPGMVLYIAGVGTVYFVGNVSVVATAKKEQQGTVAGVYNMFLDVGGAVLRVAVLTVISNSVTADHGGVENPRAALDGYQAGYYAAIAMAALGVVLSLFFRLPCLDGEKGGGECVEEPGTSA
ncbi:uncharacterized protein BO72DRAFT_496088 [Aspergillus fijiensis CBS 313.89]|uniref:Biotin carboxylation domain-containing protein n=1 Tax=Aspergillus fijiensis CBS 313.89 TaxID=1448319 RepID=A0A8G1W1V7_9EURO|nr:uncharacterized protein BO72DRAFT_496088 [Aspergillus fijiensis CBS 313.89]RAK77419.1 hypothetical protein BO72DRAFT_496088 [Aspergillus fijiensis CBS 313.89]